MGDGHIVDVAHLGQAQPGGLVGSHPGADNAALVPPDGIEGQGGAGCIGVDDLAVGYQPQLDQGLEAIANAAHQAVPVLQQPHDLLLDGRIPEEGGDELGGAVGLVAAGEAAGNEDHLAVPDALGHILHGPGHIIGGQVPDDGDIRLCPRGQNGPGRIVLAVGAGEDGDQDLGLGGLYRRGRIGSCLVAEGGNFFLGLQGLGGVDLLQGSGIQLIQLPDGDGLVIQGDLRLGSGDADLLAKVAVSGELGNDVAVAAIRILACKSNGIAEGHLHDRLGNTAGVHGPGGLYFTGLAKPMESLPGVLQAFIGAVGAEAVDTVPLFLEFIGNNLLSFQGSNGEGDHRGRHVLVQEGAGHGVLAADGRGIQAQLSRQRAKQRLEGLAPPFGISSQLFKEFLKGQIGLLVVRTGGNDLRHGGNDAHLGSHKGIGAEQLRITAPGHDAGGIGLLPGQHRQLGRHCLGGGCLVSAAEGHQQAARANGGIEPLHQAPLGGIAQLRGHLPQAGIGNVQRGGLGNRHLGVLHGTVGVQELPAQIGDLTALPGHDHPGFLGDHGNPVGLQVFLLGGGDKGIRILGGHNHCHPLLGLGDCQLGAVQAVIFFPNRIQVDAQAVGQLADGHGHTAGTEVVAALDEPGHLAVAEQPLDLPLLRGVALLDLGGHGGQGLHIVALRGAGGTANAVPAGATPQQDHNVPRGGALPAHIPGRSSGNHSAALQTLGYISIVVQFRHMAGGQADLVAVGGVARGSGLAELPLGQLAGEGVLQGGPGVTGTGDPHGLVHIGPAGERIPDAAADAGSRAAEGLDLRGVIVGLVFEHQQPVLVFSVDCGRDVDGAGVDFLALVQLRELALLFQELGADGGNVHQGLRPLSGLFLSVNRHPGSQVLVISLLHRLVVDGGLVQMGGEGGVPAVIGPVGIHHPDLRNGGIPVLLVPEIGLEEFQIVQVHGKAQFFQQSGKGRLVHGNKALHSGDGLGDGIINGQGLRQGQRGLPALHRVDDVLLDGRQLFLRHLAGKHIDLGGAHRGAVALGDDLDALGSGIRPLVILAGQRLHGEDQVPLRDLIGHVVHLGLGKNGVDGGIEEGLPDVLRVIAVQHPEPRQAADTQKVLNFLQEALRLLGLAFLFFYIYTINHVESSLLFQ